MKKSEIVFHPFFLVRLVHMIRHRDIQEAIDLAGQEVRNALDDEADETGDEEQGAGLMVVPSPRRVREFYFRGTPDEPTQPKGPKL
jgi:hypothetical protein